LASNVEGDVIFVGNKDKGSVYVVLDHNKDFIGDQVITLATGMNQPNGIAFRDGALYVMEISKLFRYDNIQKRIQDVLQSHKGSSQDAINKAVQKEIKPVLLTDKFPPDTHHGWKYLAFSPDGLLYVPVGAPCNVCIRDDKRFNTIMKQTSKDSWDFEVFATGIRNSVGFAWHPITKELWFTENGRDFADHEFPPDELNHAPKKGLHFGFPYCFGSNEQDPEVGTGINCKNGSYTPAKKNLAPHSAALGMKFYTGKMFPAEYQNQIIFAEHGSWNRIPPSGYKVSLAKLEGDKVVSYEDFATGFAPNEGHVAGGKPVDILILPDGSILVSDDYTDRIYRITYGASEKK